MDKSQSVPVFHPKHRRCPCGFPRGERLADLSFPTGCDEANRTIKAAIDLSASPWDHGKILCVFNGFMGNYGENPLVLWEIMGKTRWFYGKLWGKSTGFMGNYGENPLVLWEIMGNYGDCNLMII